MGEDRMNDISLETDRLILRRFEGKDMKALYLLLKDEKVNTFLPWFPVKSEEEAERFYRQRFEGSRYSLAICLKKDDVPIGYINADMDDSHDLGYALRREFWHRGIVTEAGKEFVRRLKEDGIPYITATHDKNNLRSGGVMRRIGMKYCYSYNEQWQPKDVLVTFRMYQFNLDGRNDRVYQKYWEMSDTHFIEEDV